MGTSTNKALKAFFSYPLTYLVISVIAGTHTGFNLWFNASLFMNSLALGLDALAFLLWFILVMKSPGFQKYFNRLPYMEQINDLKGILNGCQPEFREAAIKSLELVQKIKIEFKEHQYDSEMDFVLYNITNLAKNHRELFQRYQTFGTNEQKTYMRTVLNKQLSSVQNALHTLQSFSGNLTLIAADTEQATAVTNELKDINKGLQEVMEEVK
jgi:hypothetical protein